MEGIKYFQTVPQILDGLSPALMAHVSLMDTQISKDSQALSLGVLVIHLRMPV